MSIPFWTRHADQPLQARAATALPRCRPGETSRRRRLPSYHGALASVVESVGSSRLPPHNPSHDLLRQRLLHCICTAGGHVSGNVVPQAGATQRHQTCRYRVGQIDLGLSKNRHANSIASVKFRAAAGSCGPNALASSVLF